MSQSQESVSQPLVSWPDSCSAEGWKKLHTIGNDSKYHLHFGGHFDGLVQDCSNSIALAMRSYSPNFLINSEVIHV